MAGGVKWYLIAMVFNGMEAFDMGDNNAYERCRRITDSIELNESVAMPKKLAELLEEGSVEALACVDQWTAATMFSRKLGKPPALDVPGEPRPKLPPPRLLIPLPHERFEEKPGDRSASDL